MALTLAELRLTVRRRITDTDNGIFASDNAELDEIIALSVAEFSTYRPHLTTTTVTTVVDTLEYSLPDTCVIVNEVLDSDLAAVTGWRHDDQYLIFDAVDEVAVYTVKYGAVHALTSSSYTTISSRHKDDVCDLAEARCLEILLDDMAKRQKFMDTQVRIEHPFGVSEFRKRSSFLRNSVQVRLNRFFGSLG